MKNILIKKIMLAFVVVVMSFVIIGCFMSNNNRLHTIEFSGVEDKTLNQGEVFNAFDNVIATGNNGEDYTGQIIIKSTSYAVDTITGIVNTDNGASIVITYEVYIAASDVFATHDRNVQVIEQSDDLLINGDFSQGTYGWDSDDVLLIQQDDGADLSMNAPDSVLVLDVTVGTLGYQHVPRFGQMGIAFEENQDYSISFRARAEDARTIYFWVGRFESTDTIKVFEQYLDITTSWQTYTIYFKYTHQEHGGLVFELGDMTSHGITADTKISFEQFVINEVQLVTVTFDVDGGQELASQNVLVGQTINPPTPIKEDHRFIGWFLNSDFTQPFSSNTVINENITLYAAWEEGYQDAYFINPNFDLGLIGWNDPNVILISDNDNADMYMGVTNSVLNVSVTVGTQQYQYTPRFGQMHIPFESGKSYEVSFDARAEDARTIYFWIGQVLGEAPWSINFGVAEFLDISTGWQTYTFYFNHEIDNQLGGIMFELGDMLTNGTTRDTTLYFDNFKAREVEIATIEFDVDGGYPIDDLLVVVGDTITTPIPNKPTNDFIGWYTDPLFITEFDASDPILGSMTLYARFIPNDQPIDSYLINPNFDNGLTGWNSNQTTLNSDNDGANMLMRVEDGVLGVDITVGNRGYQYTPRFGQVYIPFQNGVSYEVSFEARAADARTIYFWIGEILTQAPWNVKFQDEFLNITSDWQTYKIYFTHQVENIRGGLIFELGDMGNYGITEDTTIYFDNFNIREVEIATISYQVNGGNALADQMVAVGEVASLKTPAKSNDTFLGWAKDATLLEVFDENTVITSDLTLYARWLNATYAVTIFDGNTEQNLHYFAGEQIEVTAADVYQGESFSYWMFNDQIVSTQNIYQFTVSQDVELIAVYGDSEAVEPSVIFSGDLKISTNTFTFSSQFFLPENFELIEVGYLTHQTILEDVTHDTTGITIQEVTEYNQHTLEFRRAYGWGSIATVRAYMMYKDANDEEHVIYSMKEITYDNPQIELVALGSAYALVVTLDSRIFAWGYNGYGSLGDGTTVNRHTPVEITNLLSLEPGETIVSLDAGWFHSLLVTSMGRVFAWGSGWEGKLGNNTQNDSLVPLEITNYFEGLANDERVIRVEAGTDTSMALTNLGSVYTWGSGGSGRLGTGNTTNQFKPVNITSNFVLLENEYIIQIEAGPQHGIALTNLGRVFTWGSGANGRLGNNSTSNQLTPIDITQFFNLSSEDLIIQISSSESFSVALTEDGNVYTWGVNSNGRLGNLSASSHELTPYLVAFDAITYNTPDSNVLLTATPLEENEKIISISAGYVHTIVLTNTGRAFAWGGTYARTFGLGVNLWEPVTQPVDALKFTQSGHRLEEGEVIDQVFAGNELSIVITTNGRIFVVGRNRITVEGVNQDMGIGDGTTTDYAPLRTIISFFPPVANKNE